MAAVTNAPIRVLQLFRSLSPEVGGPLAYLKALQGALEGSAAQLSVACLEPLPAASGVHAVHAGTGGRNAIRLAAWLNRHVRDYDVVHVHGMFGWHTLFGSLFCIRHGRPYVISTHGHLQGNALAQKAVKKGVYMALAGRGILSRARNVVATSKLEIQAVRAAAPGSSPVLVPPGLPVAAETERGRQGGPLRLLYLGRLHPHKQLHLLLDALGQVAGLDWELTLAGTGEADYEAGLRRQVEEAGWTSRVSFAGYLDADAKARALAASHVLVLPSRSENFGFAAAEALAAGLPAIVTEQVGLEDLVRGYGCGAVVPVGDAAALAKAIAQFGDPRRLQDASRNAANCARKELSPAAMRDALLAVYRGDAA